MNRTRRPIAPEPRPALAQRNAEMVRRYEGGENLARIGASLGLTRERVRQIVKDSGAVMPWAYICAVADCAKAPRAPHRYCFVHQDRFERYGDPLGARPLLREQHGTVPCYADGGCRCALCRRAAADRCLEYDHRMHPERRYVSRPPGTPASS
jgi:hypothetical protein